LVTRLTLEQLRHVREDDGLTGAEVYGMLVRNLHLAGEVPDGYLPLTESVRPLN
jgi:hypothetical protein